MGKVSPSICDDFDYKLDAHVNTNGIAEITIYRSEFDLKKLSEEFFEQENFKDEQYTRSVFETGKFVHKLRINQ